ncbi:expressed protein [Phakopsora pachyrhizi]|uniref:Expressed protein n=1 Tax=Phakopsora pachyrhizi TaxID=170000 RepID=A0AAV0B1S6_PHAPC|nr:expressed protein [Phakopsora pachyrhizi]
MIMMISRPSKIRLNSFVLQGFLAFQLISCMYENNVFKSREVIPFGKLSKDSEDVNDVSLNGLNIGAVEGPSSSSQLSEMRYLQRAKAEPKLSFNSVPDSKAIKINKENILQLRAGYEDLVNRVKGTLENTSQDTLHKFDLISLQKILDVVNILTTIRRQQLTADRTLRVAQLELQHQTELGTRSFNSDISIKITEKVLDSILYDPIFMNVLEYLLKNQLVDLVSDSNFQYDYH